MPYRTVERRCVACRALLVPLHEPVACECCAGGHGLWIETGRFLALLRAAPTAQKLDELIMHNDGSPRRPCPQCAELMDLAWIDFLQLDQCAEHGVWLDAGELQKALSSAQPNPELKALVKSLQPRRGATVGGIEDL